MIDEAEARTLFNTGHRVRLMTISRPGAEPMSWGWYSCVTGWQKTFDEHRAWLLSLSHVANAHRMYWEAPPPYRLTLADAAGHILRREAFEIGNVSGTFAFNPIPAMFGDLRQSYVDEFHRHDAGEDGFTAVKYCVWSYETLIAYTYEDAQGVTHVVMPPVRYSNTTTQHQHLTARALGVKFRATDGSFREGKGKTPYTSRAGGY